MTFIPDPLFSLFGFRPQQTTENPFAGIDPAILLKLAENLKKEAVPGANEAFSSGASLEEDVNLALYDAYCVLYQTYILVQVLTDIL